MEVILKGKLLDVDFEKWEFEGKTGIRYFGTMKTQDKKIVNFKIKSEDYDDFYSLVGTDISITCNVFITGTYKLTFKEIN